MSNSEPLLDQRHELNSESPTINKYDENKVRDTFFQLLAYFGYEHRFGKRLNKDEDVQFSIKLFTDIHMKKDFLYDEIKKS